MEIIGVKPSPRILVWGIERDSELGIFLSKIAPTIKFIANEVDLKLTRQAEWDAAILYGNPPVDPRWDSKLRVVQFGGSSITSYITASPASLVHVISVVGSVATEFIIPSDIPAQISKLVSTSLLPWLQSQAANSVIAQNNTGVYPKLPNVISPFITDGDGRPLAGCIKVQNPEWWWLPGDTPDRDMWIATALSEWSKSDPARFPTEPVWIQRSRWQTKKERDSASALQAFHEERRKAMVDFQAREQELTRQREEARTEADRCERRLLTGQGNALVQEVQTALGEIGFKVVDVDKIQAPKGTLLEDLRIEDPEVNGWVSLAEVRGYTGGAKVSDLQRIGRFVEHYIRTQGRAPSARWYIVNHNLSIDPSARPMVLAGSAEDVSIFADAGGLVIDTRILFTIHDQVRIHVVKSEDARQVLREAKGILNWPADK